jgi:hypothetical protein
MCKFAYSHPQKESKITIFQSKLDFLSANSRFAVQNGGPYLPRITRETCNHIFSCYAFKNVKSSLITKIEDKTMFGQIDFAKPNVLVFLQIRSRTRALTSHDHFDTHYRKFNQYFLRWSMIRDSFYTYAVCQHLFLFLSSFYTHTH